MFIRFASINVKPDIYTKTLLLTTYFQYKLMEHLTLRGLCGLLITSTRLSSENQALELY